MRNELIVPTLQTAELVFLNFTQDNPETAEAGHTAGVLVFDATLSVTKAKTNHLSRRPKS